MGRGRPKIGKWKNSGKFLKIPGNSALYRQKIRPGTVLLNQWKSKKKFAVQIFFLDIVRINLYICIANLLQIIRRNTNGKNRTDSRRIHNHGE